MTVDTIIENKLYAIRYPDDDDNIYALFMDRMYDAKWLFDFFANNKKDLEYFHVDINQAVEDTFEDLDAIEDIIYDEDDIDSFFQNLSLNYCESVLQKKKGKLYRQKHPSWVRLYAIKIEPNIYVITGGAIKLTEKMQDRDHTLRELLNLEKCRNFLIEHGVIDNDSLIDNQNENKQAQWKQLKN